MIKVYRVPTGILKANCYIIDNDGQTVVIDPGDYKTVRAKLNKIGAVCRAVLLTHGHFDHATGACGFQKEGAEVYCSANDVDFLRTGTWAEESGVDYTPFCADHDLKEGPLDLCGLNFEVIAAPGHSAGSVCFRLNDKLFTGDTLFLRSVGRTDLFSGSGAALKESLKKIFALPGNFEVLPGHGEPTTLDFERRHNFYAR